MAYERPDLAMNSKRQTNYSSSAASGLNYPLDLGTGEYHSYINFKVVQKKEEQHTSSEGAPKSEAAGQIKNINLYVPEVVSLGQSAQYSVADGYAGIVKEYLDQIDSGLADMGTSLGAKVLRGVADMAGENVGEVAQQRTLGLASNAAKYQLFSGIEFRKFQFNYKFNATSQDEASTIAEIIRTFRKHMLPNIKGAFYTIPDGFELEYRVLGKNTGNSSIVHKFKPCALIACDVAYGGDGSFGVYVDGTPINITMNLTFLEMQQVTKDDIDEGY